MYNYPVIMHGGVDDDDGGDNDDDGGDNDDDGGDNDDDLFLSGL